MLDICTQELLGLAHVILCVAAGLLHLCHSTSKLTLRSVFLHIPQHRKNDLPYISREDDKTTAP